MRLYSGEVILILLGLMVSFSHQVSVMLEDEVADAIVARHNAIRQQVTSGSMYKMRYNYMLAFVANATAAECEDTGYYDQRDLSISVKFYEGDKQDPLDIIEEWWTEGHMADIYNNDQCQFLEHCKKHARMIKDTARYIGCAHNVCPNGIRSGNITVITRPTNYFVCYYHWGIRANPLLLFRGGGGPCRSCDTGKFYCTKDRFCSMADEKSCPGCTCERVCLNGGAAGPDCTCKCQPGFAGHDCSVDCVDQKECFNITCGTPENNLQCPVKCCRCIPKGGKVPAHCLGQTPWSCNTRHSMYNPTCPCPEGYFGEDCRDDYYSANNGVLITAYSQDGHENAIHDGMYIFAVYMNKYCNEGDNYKLCCPGATKSSKTGDLNFITKHQFTMARGYPRVRVEKQDDNVRNFWKFVVYAHNIPDNDLCKSTDAPKLPEYVNRGVFYEAIDNYKLVREIWNFNRLQWDRVEYPPQPYVSLEGIGAGGPRNFAETPDFLNSTNSGAIRMTSTAFPSTFPVFVLAVLLALTLRI